MNDSSEPIDLETEWPEVAGWFGGDDDDREPLWLFPVALLYVGFFFGPFVTVLAAMFTLKGRITLRHAAFLTGVAGTAWCLIQGVSAWNASSWTEYGLQGFRATCNFLNGIAAYVTVRKLALATMRPTRKTILWTAAFFAAGVCIFIVTPGKLLVALGR